MAIGTRCEDDFIRIGDEELVRRVYAAVRRIHSDENDDDVDELYWLLGEAFERFCPGAEWADHVRYYTENFDDPAEREREIVDAWQSKRHREGARMLQRAFEKGGD